MRNNFSIGGIFQVICKDKLGNIKWEDTTKNLIVNAGLDHLLDVLCHSGTQTTTWYLGLKGSGTIVAADTLASHTNWSEVTPYAGSRPAWPEDAVSGQSITNTTTISITINDSATVSGSFLSSVATGTSGILLCAADFSGGDRTVVDTDTLFIRYTLSATSS